MAKEKRPVFSDLLKKQKEGLAQARIDPVAYYAGTLDEREDILFDIHCQSEYLGLEKSVNAVEPMVSVAIAAYRHEKFIRQAIEGALMQETTFPIEIIIGEDGSDDKTPEICKEYAEKHPDIIRLFLNPTRSMTFVMDEYGHIQRGCNWQWTFRHARGKYIAMCEGDDYWTDPHKLQRQVDFLESHPDYSMVFHEAIEHWEDGSKPDAVFYVLEEREYTWKELGTGWKIATASAVLRRDVFECEAYKRALKCRDFIYGDMPLWLSALSIGKIYALNDVMSVYRRHKGGATFTKGPDRTIKIIKNCQAIPKVFGRKYRYSAVDTTVNLYGTLYAKAIIDHQYGRAFKYFCSSAKYTFFPTLKHLIKIIGEHIRSRK